MFNFRGRLSPLQYIVWCIVTMGLFVLSVLLFPLLLLWFGKGCAGVNGACGAIALVVAFYVKPPIAIAFLFALVAPAIRRARDAGVSPWLGLFVPLLFLADYQFFLFGAAPWSLAFTMGVLGFPLPFHAALGVVSMAALALLPTRPENLPSRHLRPLGAFALGVAALVSLPAMVRFLMLGGLSPELLVVLRPVFFLEPYLMVGCGLLLLAAAFAHRVTNDGGAAETPRTATPVRNRMAATLDDLPIGSLIIAAFAVALVAIAISSGVDMLLFGLFSFSLFAILIPTALVYFLPLLALALFWKRRWRAAALAATVALLPLASWAYDSWQSAELAVRLRSEVAELPPKAAIDTYPSTLVLASSGGLYKGADVGITRNIRGKPGNYYSTELTVTKNGRQRGDTSRIAELPSRYLLLRTGKDSRFYKTEPRTYPQPYKYKDLTPYELVLVTEAGEQFIAARADYFVRQPAMLPVLSFAGWSTLFDRNESGNRTDASIQEFLASALTGAQPEAAEYLPKLPD